MITRIKKLMINSSYNSVINRRFFDIYLFEFIFFFLNSPVEDSLLLFFLDSGFTEFQFGLLKSLNEIVHIFLPALISYLAIRKSASKIGIVGIIICMFGSIVLGAFNMNLFFMLLICAVLLSGRTIVNFSFGNAINLSVSSDKRGKFLAVRDLFLFSGVALGLILGGAIISYWNFDTMYLVFGIGFILAIIALNRAKGFVKKGKPEDEEKEKKVKFSFGRIIKNKVLLAYIAINFMSSIYAIAFAFMPSLGKTLGVEAATIITSLGFMTLVNAVFALIIGHFSDLNGKKKYYVFDLFSDCIPALIFAFTRSSGLFIFGIFCSMLKDVFAPSSFAYFYDCFEGDEAIFAQGVLGSVDSALCLFLPTLFGLFWKQHYQLFFIIAAVGSIIAAIIAYMFLPNTANNESKGVNIVKGG